MAFESVITALEGELKASPLWVRFQAGCPGWDLRFRIMDHRDEIIDWNHKIIWLAMFRWPDPIFRWMHAEAHVRYSYGQLVDWTPDQERYADEFATYELALSGGILRPKTAA